MANKDELLSGMIDVIVGEIPSPATRLGWKAALRARILAAREVMLRHSWAAQVIASRSLATPAVLGYVDSLIAIFRSGDFPADLTHQVLHTLGSRMWGFNIEVFPSPPPPADPAERTRMLAQLAAAYPHIAEVAAAGVHQPDSIVGTGCDDQAEFEFGLDVLLDGFERLLRRRRRGDG